MDNLNLNNEVEKSTNLLKRLHEEFDAKVRQDQKELLDLVLQNFMEKLDKDENGNVLNNDRNRRMLQSIETTFADFNRANSVELVKTILSGVYSLLDYNSNYFSMMSGNVSVTKLTSDTKQLVNEWLGIKDGKVAKNGYLDTLINDTTAKKLVQNFANKTVIAQTGYNGAKSELQKIISGNKDTLGALEKYHRNFTYDLYSQVDSAVANEMRQSLDLQFAIYDGDIIDTSRKFCRENIKKVFHISEINAIEITEARPPNYNPIQDRGGYGCRHRWFWISDSLAKRLRPDVVKFLEEYEFKDKKKDNSKEIKKAIETIDELPKGRIFDDAKLIDGIFGKSKYSWSEVIENFEKNKDKGKIEFIKVKDIKITQPNIQSEKVKNMLTNLDKVPIIDVVEFKDGTQAIFDGHHRLTSAWVLGETKIKVNLVRL